MTVTDWPPHTQETRTWQQSHRGGTKADRTLREIAVSLPPPIATQDIRVNAALMAELERAMRTITELEGDHGTDLEALGVLLLRTEAVASSKIEAVEASLTDYARALHGVRSNASAIAMVAATTALDLLVGKISPGESIRLDDVLAAHALLMRDDSTEQSHAGRLRTMQNWIGGSDFSPRAALYVPPPPELVPAYMDDLLAFANRDDLPTLPQAALAHAQFESIHPFTDGNGRIGRALINTIFRRRGVTTHAVVPLASSLVAHRDRYFDLLDSYRSGEIRPLISSFTAAATVAASESRRTASRLRTFRAEWQAMAGNPRGGSAVAQLLDQLMTHPILTADEAGGLINARRSSVFAAIGRLTEREVLRPLTNRKRDQIWGAGLILDELDDLGVRIARASR